MDEFIRQGAVGGDVTLGSALLSLFMSFVLATIMAYTYKQTHRGLSYSMSFVHTIVIMAVTVSIIMTIIGSNIARAFALVGALSIIRFRTAIKDPRDVAFIFMAMASGMACGVGFHLIAVAFTLFVCPVVYFLHRFDIGAMPTSEVMLKVQLPENLDYHTVFNELFYRLLQSHTLLSVESVHGGTLMELVYSIHFKEPGGEQAFMDEVRAINGNHKVALLTGQQNVNV